MGKKKTTNEFIVEARDIHGDKYNYDLVEYKNAISKVKIKCIKCIEIFYQSPDKHLQKRGCPKCAYIIRADKRRSDINEFIKKARDIHGDKYNYDLVEYKKAISKVKIKCIKCNDVFEQRAIIHLSNHGCPNCVNVKRLTTQSFIEKSKVIHGDKYNYDLVEYKSTKIKVKIKCIKCRNLFEQQPNNHLQGNGCPNCVNKTELIIYTWLKDNYENVQREAIFEGLPNARFDFYLEDLDLVIELDGAQHFRQVANWCDFKETQKKDKFKMDFCINNNISVIRVLQEDLFNNEYDWCLELAKYIKNYDRPIVKMLDINDEYEVYSEYFKYDPEW